MSDQPDPPPIRLTHLDDAGAARMVDVTAKAPTVRTAGATAFVACAPGVVAALRDGSVPKGDVLAVARVAGIAAAKRVPDLLPLAHVIGVHGCAVDRGRRRAHLRDRAHRRPHGRGDGGADRGDRRGPGGGGHGQGH